jgi:hypothetical protein
VCIASAITCEDVFDLQADLCALSVARKIAGHLDLQDDLELRYELTLEDDLYMYVEGEDSSCLEYVKRCREAGVRVYAFREDDETEYRLA